MSSVPHTLTPYQRKRRLVLLRRANREALRPSSWLPSLAFLLVAGLFGYLVGFGHGVVYLGNEVDARFECSPREVVQ